METNLDTNEVQETVLALSLMSEQLSHIVDTGNPHYWSWVIVALHNALQGFMVLALRGSNNLNVLSEKCAAEWLVAFRRGDGKYPKQILDKFLNLYKKIKSDRMKIYVNSCAFKPRGSQSQSIKYLNSLRNEFIHFVPAGWMITVDEFPQVVEDCIDIMFFLAFECGNIMWRKPELKEQSRMLIEKAKADANRLKQAYSG